MAAVYAKIRKAVQSFLVLSLVLTLAACGGGGPTGYVPWNFNTGVVTKDPKSMPDIAWQTPNQREVLNRESEAFARQQTASETGKPAEERQSAVAIPPPAAAPVLKPQRKARVALLVPLSGKSADLGQAMLNAAQMALFDVGSANVSLMPADTKSTPEGAAAAAREAVADGADIILGPVFSEDLKAVRPAAGSVPVVSFSTDWSQAGGGVYVMGFMPFAQVARVAQYAQSRGYTRLAVYAPQTEYCDVVISTLSRAGVRPVRVDRYSPQQTDLAVLVRDFAETSGAAGGAPSFDSLLLPVGGESLRTLISHLDAAKALSGNVRLVGTGLWDDASLSNSPLLYGGWYAAPDPRLRADFDKRYRDNYGSAPARLASLAYDATALAAVLAHSGGGYTRETLTNPRGFAGIDGIFRFRSDGLAERGLAVLEIQPGKPKIVDPAPTAFISSGS